MRNEIRSHPCQKKNLNQLFRAKGKMFYLSKNPNTVKIMKRLISIFVILSSITGLILFTGCPDDDVTKPRILFPESMELHQDTVVLLQRTFEDPGVYVEDNKTFNENIILESDFEDEINLTNDGKTRFTGEYEITYTATDEAGNEAEAVRTVRIANPAELIEATYDVEGSYNNIEDTTFISRISPDARTPGKIRFSKTYVHNENNEDLYLRINGYLYSPDHSPDVTSSTVDPTETAGLLGTPGDVDNPFYSDMYYHETMDVMDRYEYIYIPLQYDTLNNIEYTLAGRTDNETNLPKSKIFYGANDVVTKVEIQYNISAENIPGGETAKEVYTPR
jgi:hypothetical protein